MRVIDKVLTFDEKAHRYFMNGRAALGVSQILQLSGISNFQFVNRDLLDRAQRFGTAAHSATALSDRATLDKSSLDAPLVPYLDAWKLFCEKELREILYIEEPVYSLRFNFAGTLDRIAVDNKRRETLVDIKTSKEFSPSAKLQTAGYQLAFEEMHKPFTIARRVGVILQEDGTYYAEDFKDRSDRDDFLACARVAAFKLKNGLKGGLNVQP
jgi:hypothetical protein